MFLHGRLLFLPFQVISSTFSNFPRTFFSLFTTIGCVHRPTVINTCNVFEEGLAEFIRSCTNIDVKGNNSQHGKEEVHVPVKRTRARAVRVKPSVDVGCIC
jgi:hypothetical protein